MKMVRKQVYITPEQEEKLKALSRRLGSTEAELIRRCISNEMDELEAGDAEDAAVELLALLREREASLPNGGGTANFFREDLYIR